MEPASQVVFYKNPKRCKEKTLKKALVVVHPPYPPEIRNVRTQVGQVSKDVSTQFNIQRRSAEVNTDFPLNIVPVPVAVFIPVPIHLCPIPIPLTKQTYKKVMSDTAQLLLNPFEQDVMNIAKAIAEN